MSGRRIFVRVLAAFLGLGLVFLFSARTARLDRAQHVGGDYGEDRQSRGWEPHVDRHDGPRVRAPAPRPAPLPHHLAEGSPSAGVTPAMDGGEWFLKLDDRGAARDPHLSEQTLHAFIAERVAIACDQVASDGARWLVAPAALQEAAEAIAPHCSAVLDFEPQVGQRAADETRITLRREGYIVSRRPWWPAPMEQYTLIAEVAGPRGSAVVQAKLDEKPWLFTPPQREGSREYAVVTSGEPAVSREEALQSLHLRVTPTVAERVAARLAAAPGPPPSPDDVRRQVEARFGQNTAAAADTCVVAVDRPFGRVWFAASLIPVGDADLGPLVASAKAVHTQRRQTYADALVGLVFMLLVLGGVYVVLNALTRGYFRGQLRAAVVVALVVAAAMIFLLIA
jgi:hypothetical protein